MSWKTNWKLFSDFPESGLILTRPRTQENDSKKDQNEKELIEKNKMKREIKEKV
jgi:hypothetical protein